MQESAATQPLVVANLQIRRDREGRFCLNDIHQAAGSRDSHRPSRWLRGKQTQELLAHLEGASSDLARGLTIYGHAPLSVVNDGFGNGTYVVKPLVYAYAMWISASFHLAVIQAYDALVANQPAPAAAPAASAALHAARAQIVTRLYRATKTGEIQALHDQAAKLSEGLGLPAPEMPTSPASKTDALLAEFWRAVDAALASGRLHSHARNPALLALNLPEVRVAAKELGIALPQSSGLTMLLRSSSRLLHAGQAVNSLHRGRTLKCWVFSA